MTAILTQAEIDQLNPLAIWEDEEGNFRTSQEYIEKIYNLLELTIPTGIIDTVNLLESANSFKIYQYVSDPESYDDTVHPKTIIFPDQLDYSLPKTCLIDNGERLQSIYYGSYDAQSNTYSDEVIKVVYQYFRDTDGYATHRTRTIHWALQNGLYHATTKVHTKYYATLYDKQTELTQRRKNVVIETKSLAEMMGLRTAIGDLFNAYESDISKYQDGGNRDFADKLLTDSTFTWLDQDTLTPGLTIRTFLNTKFMIGILN